jgi:hypothetical protein
VKRITALFAITIFSLAFFLPCSLNIRTVSAQNSNYSIQDVEHKIEVMYSGQIIISDTITVTGQVTGDFLIGFPEQYGTYVLKGVAYDENGMLPMTLDVSFEGHNELYGASISFSQGSSQVFTVVFILSNEQTFQNNTLNAAAAKFPPYPSLAKKVTRCNVTIVLPDFASDISVYKDGVSSNETNFVEENLAAFTSSTAVVGFTMPTGILQIASVKSLKRVITLNPAGDVMFSDSYRVLNNGNDSLIAFGVEIPLDASNIVGEDEFGRNLTIEIVGNSTTFTFNYLNVTFISSLTKDDYAQFTVEYNMPRVPSEQITNFAIDFDLLTYFDYYITDASIIIVPPEGATFQTYDSTASLTKVGFQETLTFNKEGVSHIDLDLPVETAQITYFYNPLWLSYLPTLWVWILAAAGCIAIAFWRRPKTSTLPKTAASKLSISLSPEHIRAFTDAYEEKNRITSELKLLDTRAQKGKIPRRRYKVQKRKLEVRFAALTKEIAELKNILRGASGNYAGLVRQLDSAEAELSKVETDTINVESRFKNGAISLEEHKKLLAEHQQRKEKAEIVVNGILLRLREETR